jgi:FixJ family two-component response regulator
MKRKLHIALIDYNKFHVLLFERTVAENYPDYRVSVFNTGGAFLEVLPDSSFDMAFVDQTLPDIKGIELISQLHTELPDMPIIAIISDGLEHKTVECMKAGAYDFITKDEEYSSAIPRIIRQTQRKQTLILRERRMEVQRRDTEKMELAAMMAATLNHEINNPLMAILGNVELLQNENICRESPLFEKLKMIEISARRIQEITQRMSDLISPEIKETPVGPMLESRKARPAKRRRQISDVFAR